MSARLTRQAISLACAYLTWSPPGHSQMPVTWRGSENAPTLSAQPRRDSVVDERRNQARRDEWTLAIEGVTHAPVDWGFMLGLQTPPGLRVSGGVGWVPDSYMTILTNVAGSASGNGYASALLQRADYAGRTWRVQVGFRPFRTIGLYADVGYAHLTAQGSLALKDSGVAQLEALEGSYLARTDLDMWLVELGYQGQVANRLVLGMGLGVMGTWNASTTLSAVDGARRSNWLDTIANDTDTALEKYGIVPTLTLRLGFDLI